MTSLFRSLIIIANAAYLLWFFQPYYPTGLYTEEMRQLLESDGYGGNDLLLEYSGELGWVILILYLVAAVGLFFYVRPARTLFAVLMATSLILPLAYGASVQSHIDVLLSTIGTLCDGVILYMSYLSSVAGNFTAHNKRSRPRPLRGLPAG